MKTKFLLLALLTFLLNSSCKKENSVLTQVQIKIVHRTCVQTIASVLNNNTIGENWTNFYGTTFSNCFNIGKDSNIVVDSLNQVFTVNIKTTGTRPEYICAMVDVVGTQKVYDVTK